MEDDRTGRGVASGQVPQPRSFVPAPRDEQVVADSDGIDNGLVAVEDDGAGRGVGGGQIPQPRVLSQLPVMSQWLSGLTATALIEASWPWRTTGLAAGLAAVRSHSRAVLSPLPVTAGGC